MTFVTLLCAEVIFCLLGGPKCNPCKGSRWTFDDDALRWPVRWPKPWRVGDGSLNRFPSRMALILLLWWTAPWRVVTPLRVGHLVSWVGTQISFPMEVGSTHDLWNPLILIFWLCKGDTCVRVVDPWLNSHLDPVLS